MLTLHAFTTPNSLKPLIALEELGLTYSLQPVDLRKGEQRSDAFRSLNPNGKVPVLTDLDPAGHGLVLSESAAILVHLAEQAEQLLPTERNARAKVFEQLLFHASGVSPAFLQAFLVAIQKEPDEAARERALKEVDRVLGVLDQMLGDTKYVAGQAYTIADIAHFGWVWRHAAVGASLDQFAHVARWYEQLSARPAVQSAIAKITTLAA
jgi:GSH-dependent disulfide-bond oxidoreductase